MPLKTLKGVICSRYEEKGLACAEILLFGVGSRKVIYDHGRASDGEKARQHARHDADDGGCGEIWLYLYLAVKEHEVNSENDKKRPEIAL